MGQSLSQLYVHLVFGTKKRHHYIAERIAPSLHSYIAGILKNMESPALKINSQPDHIHILFRLSKNHTFAKIVQNVKKDSSKWMKSRNIHDFAWQNGYGAFSVSNSKVQTIKSYILNQKEHHRFKTFKEEIESFVQNCGVIEYDKQYFWR